MRKIDRWHRWTGRLLIGLLGACFLHFSASAEIYRWVDENGQVHYGDQPGAGAESLLIEGPPILGTAPGAKTDSPQDGADKSLSAGELVRCLRRQGVKYYSASWCPQCARQKKMFGPGARSLPLVECSVDGGREQTSACQRAGIKAYPTWVFADGSRSAGVKSLASLAKRSGCSGS